MRLRTYSTLGWYTAQALGALHFDQSENLALAAWMLEGEASGTVRGADFGSRRSGKSAELRLAMDQAQAECAPKEEGVIYVRG
jgi:hypothetical protein